eukprot:Skav205940  [mRNA]  locus=scaffold442:16874:19589:- [translate_table: standard]
MSCILQASILLMKDLFLDAPLRAVTPPRLKIRELRRKVCACYDDLKAHVAGSHNVPFLEFIKERDSISGDPACSHCGQLFESVAGLRQHILHGRCPMYDHEKPCDESPMPPAVHDMLHSGHLPDLGEQEDLCKELTVECVCCGASFQRPQDLATHLQFTHAPQWKQAQPTLKLLTLDFPGAAINPALQNSLQGQRWICGDGTHPHLTRWHLAIVHTSQNLHTQQILQQIIPVLVSQQSQLFRCDACGMYLNHPNAASSPEASEVLEWHFFAHCPVAYQLSILFADRHGRRLHGELRGLPTDGGCIQGAGYSARPKWRNVEEAPSQRRRTRRISTDSSQALRLSLEARTGTQQSTKDGHIRDVLLHGTRRSAPASPPKSEDLEGGLHSTKAPSESGSGQMPLSGTLGSLDPHQQQTGRGRDPAQTSGEEAPSSRHELAVQDLEPNLFPAEKISPKRSAPMPQMLKHCVNLVELVQEERPAVKFQSLRPPNPKSSSTTHPWKLQVHTKRDELWELLPLLSHRSPRARATAHQEQREAGVLSWDPLSLMQGSQIGEDQRLHLMRAIDCSCLLMGIHFTHSDDSVKFNPCQLHNFETICLPFFADELGLDCVWQKYVLTAAVCHHGMDRAGHYTSLLFLNSTFPDMQALQTDDNQAAQFCDPNRTKVAERATLLWYNKHTAVELARQDMKLAALTK